MRVICGHTLCPAAECSGHCSDIISCSFCISFHLCGLHRPLLDKFHCFRSAIARGKRHATDQVLRACFPLKTCYILFSNFPQNVCNRAGKTAVGERKETKLKRGKVLNFVVNFKAEQKECSSTELINI